MGSRSNLDSGLVAVVGLAIATVIVRFAVGAAVGDTDKATNVLAWFVAGLLCVVAYLAFRVSQIRADLAVALTLVPLNSKEP